MKEDIYKNMRTKKNECYTSLAESEKLIGYLVENNLINKSSFIWLPFDNELSNIYISLIKYGFKNLILSNLELGLDFFKYEPKKWDLIISNPPFSNRTNLMNRLIAFNKPFIILQATQFFNNQFAVKYLCDYNNDFKLLLPRSRMNFLTYNKTQDIIKSSKSAASFYSFWLCYKINLKNTFNHLPDNGREKEIESFDKKGNLIINNHWNLFKFLN